MKRLFEDPTAKFFSRELSWMAFNDRVLEEAGDPTNPLLERLKYLSIVSGNLEEFFMVRVAQLQRIQNSERNATYLRDGFTASRLIEKIRVWAKDQKDRQAKLYEEIRAGLANLGLIIEDKASDLAKEIFEEKVAPFLAPIRIPEGGVLPAIQGRKIYLLGKHGTTFSLIPLPPELPRMLIVKTKHIFLVDRLISTYKNLALKTNHVEDIISFKVSRDAEIALDEDAEDLLKEVEEALEDRNNAPIVRVEIDSLAMSETAQWLKQQLGIEEEKFLQVSLPLDLKSFSMVYNIKRFKKMKFQFPEPARPKQLTKDLSSTKYFRILDKNDILLHHPYQSFDPVAELVRHASEDPKVTRICQTLYRTSRGSPILESLTNAAKKGKKVTVLVEIKARFDEANNIRWAKQLEKAGAIVVYGTPEIKVHAKLTYVERKMGSKTRNYVHLSTGNYHPITAKLYTDIGLITSNFEDAQDAKALFDLMEEMENKSDYSLLNEPEKFTKAFKKWTVAPTRLREQIIEWIELEIQNAKSGKPSGIKAKMNGLVEEAVIQALYKASQAGVKIDLLVRGICCLRPGVPGLSDNIRVRSIVDKYLEHSRFFIFENGGDRKVYLSSADWMPRNFFRRIELAVPVKNPRLTTYIHDVIWATHSKDNVRSRECMYDGHYERIMNTGEVAVRSQFEFEKMEMPIFPVLEESHPKASPAPSRESPLKK